MYDKKLKYISKLYFSAGFWDVETDGVGLVALTLVALAVLAALTVLVALVALTAPVAFETITTTNFFESMLQSLILVSSLSIFIWRLGLDYYISLNYFYFNY